MPNWVLTRVSVSGENADKFMAWVEEHKKNLFDSTIPMPKTFKDYDTTNHADGKGLVVGKKVMDMQTGQEFVVTEDFVKNIKKATELQGKVYGVVGWYEWHIKNWGTKWEAINVDVYSDKVEFDTAWNVADPIIQKWSEMFKDTEFCVEYADEDFGNNCGEFAYENGEQTYYYPGDEAFARELWGCEEDEEEEDE